MVLKYLAQIIVVGAQVVGRAVSKAVREEITATRAAAERHRANAQNESSSSSSHSSWHASADSLQGISLQEAKQILDIDNLDPESINKKYEHLFSVNDKVKGGSLYLQSKVVRAKERIDFELSLNERAKEKENVEKTDQEEK